MMMFSMDDMVPQNHMLRLIERAINWNFIYDLVEEKYCPDNGRPSMDPVMLIKIPFIQYLYGIKSMRQTMKEIEVNVAYRWFLGLDMLDPVPHFSTFGKNYTRRFKDTDLFEQIFSKILEDCMKYKLVNTEQIFVDATHVKLITRHVWEEYMEVVEDIRHTIGNRQIYQLRKETIERIFGTAKEQHGFRYTQYVGKARMEMKAGLTFACMNLKKLAKILEKRGWNTARFLLILKKIKRKEVLKEKWCWA